MKRTLSLLLALTMLLGLLAGCSIDNPEPMEGDTPNTPDKTDTPGRQEGPPARRRRKGRRPIPECAAFRRTLCAGCGPVPGHH